MSHDLDREPTPELPPLLELGLLLSALHACLWLGLALVGGLLVGVGVGAASLVHPVALFPAGLVGGLAGLVLGIYIAWSLLVVYACWATWNGSRAWAWGLAALTVAGLADFGLLSTPIRILTLVGLVQWLGTRRAQVA